MGNKLRLIIIIASVALAFFLGYEFFLKPAPAEVGLATTKSVDKDSLDILTLLDRMHHLSLDGSVFSGALFQSLKDFGVKILPEPYGRPNPFAPISSRGAPAKTAPSASLTSSVTDAAVGGAQ